MCPMAQSVAFLFCTIHSQSKTLSLGSQGRGTPNQLVKNHVGAWLDAIVK